MRELGLSSQNKWSYSDESKDDRSGYIMLNPTADIKLLKSDFLYVIVPELKLPGSSGEEAINRKIETSIHMNS